MNVKRAVFAILVGGVVLAFSISRAVVDTSRIEEVLKKNVLTQQDMQIIDEFVQDAVQDLARTTDFTEVAKTRTIVLNHRSSQAQYAQQFSESAYRHIAAGFDYAREQIADPIRRFKVATNLLILIDNLKDPRLVDLAVARIGHESSAVRYWALRASVDSELWSKLPAARQPVLAGQILQQCLDIVDRSTPDVLGLMADFASRHNRPEADQLLIRVADTRIARYANWSVRYELMDSAILKALSDKIAAGGAARPELAKRFAQLLSFVMQRSIKGQREGLLKEINRNYLASVILQVEEKSLGTLLGARQPGLIRAVQENNLDTLQAEHDRLLGGGGQTGALVSALSINYGSAGTNRTDPLPLPDPPQSRPGAPMSATAQQ
jgi:hypothetical protein